MSDSQSWKVFESVNPTFAARLSLFDEEDSGLKITQTEVGEENIFDSRKSVPRFFHDQKGAFLEARAWVADSLRDIDEKVEVLVVYGIGMGWHWNALLPWLERKRERRLIFIEDDLRVVSCFMKSSMAHSFFLHPQTSLVALQGIDDKEGFDLLIWNLFRRKWKWLVSPPYTRLRPKAALLLFQALSVKFSDAELVADEFSTFGVAHTRNLLRNLLLLNKSMNAADLFGRWKGVPIIVVAAGPSLQEALPFIQKISDQALILSGGSSTNALLEAGIIPHFAATVDPNPMQYSRLKYIEPFSLPLFYRSRALNEGVVASGANPLIYLKGGDGYPLISYFEETLGIDGPVIDGGDSVSSLLIELAVALGSSTIIMVGYDLAYTGGKRYSSTLENTLHESEKLAYTKKEIGQDSDERGTTLEVASNDGKTVLTEMKWVTEAQWITRYYELVKDEVKLFNTASGGMAIEGIPYCSIHQVYDDIFKERAHLRSSIDSLHKVVDELMRVQLMSERVTQEKLGEALRGISDEICAFEEIVKNVIAKLMSAPFELISLDSEYVELLCKLETAFAMKWLFKPFWQMHEKWYLMKKRLEIKSNGNEVSQEEMRFDEKAIKERVEFIYEGIMIYKRLFFSAVSWAFLQGQFFDDPYAVAPWPDVLSKNEAPVF